MSSTSPTITAVAGQRLALTGPVPRPVFFAIFTISGFAGLIYESIWSHYLKLFLGHAAYAQSLVLIIYMGGLALGSWLIAKSSGRWRAPLLVYAIVEAVIGVVGLVFHDVYAAVAEAFFLTILPAFDGAAVGSLLKWAAAAALILPQSVLLGMTFPLMSAGILRRYPDRPGASLAMLYFTNSIGAAIGVLASGFWLIGLVGLPGTIMTAGLLNLALALVVWTLVKLDPARQDAALEPAGGTRRAQPDTLAVLFVFAAAVTGASSFMYEVGWIRMLSLVLGSTTHSFELMLSAFITGLAFGGLWIKRRIDSVDDPVRYAGWIQVAMGAMAIVTLPLYVASFDWMAAMLAALTQTDSGYRSFMLLSHGITLAIMVPTTFLAGMTLPLFTHVLMRRGSGERAIGQIYAANTCGAIAGVLFAVHVGMPLLGLKNLIGFAAAIDVLLGLLLIQRSADASKQRAALQAGVVGAAVIVAVMASVDLDPRRLGSGVYRYRTAELGASTEVLFYEDGKTSSISLTRDGSVVTISTNGKPDASIQMDPARSAISDEITMAMAGAVPLAYRPDARRAANIGLGSGLTTHTLLGAPSIERVDTIEIERAMITAAHGFADHVGRTFTDPRSSIHLEDAKTFFSEQSEKYDVIVSEPSNPWVSGVANLFSQEFYRRVRTYLAEDGIFVQWVHLYEFDDDLALSVLRALSLEFSDYAIYNTDNSNVLIVATPNGRLGAPSFERLFDTPLAPELKRVGLYSAADFAVRNTALKPLIDGLLAHSAIPANSDFFPYVDLNAGAARFRSDVTTLFYSWSVMPLPMLEMLGMAEFALGDVNPDRTFQRTRAIGDARALHAALAAAAPDLSLPADGSDSLVTLVRLLAADCTAAAGAATTWAKSLHELARRSLPFLGPREAVEILDAAAPPECRDHLGPGVGAWLDLYSAVASRDGAEMADAATAILAGGRATDVATESYALSAGMLGAVAAAKPALAVELWERYGGGATDPDTRLLLSLAVSRASARESSH
jgi:spermidine synthase